MREVLTRYGRHNIGFLWLFAEPMLFTLGVTALWTALKSVHGSNLPIVAFALTGYSAVLLWRNMPGRCSNAIQPNLALLHHRHIKVMDVFASRLLLEAAGVTVSFVTLSLLFTFIGWISPPDDVLLLAFGWIMLAWFGAALGVTIGALSERSELVDKLWHPMSYLMFPLSGAGFLVEWLPPKAQAIVLMLPMVHGTEMLRAGYFGSAIRSHYDIGYMAVCCVFLSLMALALLRDAARRVVPE
jgi:ABC-type polysaccharide/polyol phosphate export permease